MVSHLFRLGIYLTFTDFVAKPVLLRWLKYVGELNHLLVGMELLKIILLDVLRVNIS